jgi:hypothetical protein
MNIFNLDSDFSKKELKKVFLEKIDQIKKSDISDDDKNILIDYYHSKYNHYKQFALDNDNTKTNTKILHNSSYSSKSYVKKLNPDNTYTVIEEKESNINGKIDKSKNSYILDTDGNKIKQLF